MSSGLRLFCLRASLAFESRVPATFCFAGIGASVVGASASLAPKNQGRGGGASAWQGRDNRAGAWQGRSIETACRRFAAYSATNNMLRRQGGDARSGGRGRGRGRRKGRGRPCLSLAPFRNAWLGSSPWLNCCRGHQVPALTHETRKPCRALWGVSDECGRLRGGGAVSHDRARRSPWAGYIYWFFWE